MHDFHIHMTAWDYINQIVKMKHNERRKGSFKNRWIFNKEVNCSAIFEISKLLLICILTTDSKDMLKQ